MMTQSVMTQAVNLLGNASGSVTSKGKQKANSFDFVIDQSLKANQNISDAKDVQKTSTQTPKKENDKSDAVADDSQMTSKTEKARDPKTAAQTQDKADTDNTVKKAAKPEETKDISIDPETMEKIAAMLSAVKETVLDLLNLTSEELDQLLADQGMELSDLLNPENLQQLVLANAGQSNLLSVLTDENLANTMKQLLQAVEDIKNNSGLDISMEQVKSILDSIKQRSEVEGTSEEVVSTTGQREALQQSETMSKPSYEKKNSSDIQEGHKEVQVEVTRITDGREDASQSELTRDENRELSSEQRYEAFLNNLANTNTNTQVQFENNAVRLTEIREIADQIIERIRVTIRPEQTSMELQLNPEHLGKVSFSVQSKNGLMTAQFVVQNEISKEAIESQINTLRETLNQQGIKVDSIDVTVASYTFEQNPNEQAETREEGKRNSGNRIILEDAMNMSEDTTASEEAAEPLGIPGSTIDYTA
jgi:flagellar hook-length control protein FliK